MPVEITLLVSQARRDHSMIVVKEQSRQVRTVYVFIGSAGSRFLAKPRSGSNDVPLPRNDLVCESSRRRLLYLPNAMHGPALKLASLLFFEICRW